MAKTLWLRERKRLLMDNDNNKIGDSNNVEKHVFV